MATSAIRYFGPFETGDVATLLSVRESDRACLTKDKTLGISGSLNGYSVIGI